MESSSNNNINNEELKGKEKEKENGIRYDPLTNDILRGLLKNSKGIETLWKKIKDNKDGKKLILYKYENDLVKLVADFTKAFQQVKKNDKDNTINLGKNLASKTEYNNMVTKLLSGDTKTATEFIKKFPHWTIQVGDLFANSVHYRRIATKVSGSDMKEEDIDLTSNFDVAKKSGDKKTGKESKKGFFKSISSFFSKYIKRGGMGKASKSKVTIELAKFGTYVNEPWRRWWETVAAPNTELSKKKAKEFLKSALSDSTSDSKAKLVCLFNTGMVKDNNAGSEGPYVKLVDKDNGARIVVDEKAGAVNQMYQIFKAIDAKLGNKAEELFNDEESAKNLDTNDDKIKRLIELHKIFYTDKKAIRFSEVFDKLGIKTNAKPNEENVAAKVDELFNGSTFSNNENAKKDVKQLAEDARNFLENYYDSDKTNRLLYELKFLGSCFKINDLNKVENVDQAINILKRLPKNHVQEAIKENDQEAAKIIEDELQKSIKSITSLDGALKGLENVDFNTPESQNKLLAALSAIVTKGLIDGVSEGKISLVEFINKLLSIESGKYKSIAEKIQNMEIYKNNSQKDLADFIDELKKPLKEAEAKKIEEKKKKIDNNIQTVKTALDKITTDVNKTTRITTKVEVENAIAAIKTCKDLKDEKGKECTYVTKDGRKKFLSDVAQRLGVQIEENKIQDLCKSKENLKSPYDKMSGALLVQKLRNLIGYGLGYGTSKIKGIFKADGANSLPDLNDKNLVKTICDKLEIKN